MSHEVYISVLGIHPGSQAKLHLKGSAGKEGPCSRWLQWAWLLAPLGRPGMLHAYHI